MAVSFGTALTSGEKGDLVTIAVNWSMPAWFRALELETLGNATRPVFGLLWEIE